MDEIIDVTDGARAEQVQPAGYNAHRITEPPADVDWQDVVTYVPADPGDVPAVLPRRVVKDVIRDLGAMRLAADMVAAPGKGKRVESRGLAEEMSREAHRLQRVLLQFLGGALIAALAVAVTVAGFAAPQSAQAAATPPVASISASLVDAPTYRVVLSAPTVTLRVPLVTSGPVPDGLGLRCAAVWGRTAYGVGLLARSCGYTRLVTVRVRLDARQVPAGRSTIWLEDESDPGVLAPANLVALRPSQVTGAYAADDLAGRMFVAALVEHYQAAAGTWAPSKLSPLYVQVATRRGWRTKGTITTDVNGQASGHVVTGAGTFLVRVVRPVGATVTSAVSTVQRVTVTDTAIDLA